MRKKKIKLSHSIFVIIIVMLVGTVVLNITLMYNITLDQTEEIGRMRIQNIASDFEKFLARAESTFDRVSGEFEDLLLEGTTEEEIRHFLSDQRTMEYELSEGHCLNVFCVVDGVVMISEMDTPEDYGSGGRF